MTLLIPYTDFSSNKSMNEQLQAQLTQVLSAIMTSVGEVKDFSITQLPDIAQQYITYGIVMCSIGVVVNLIVTIVLLTITQKMFRRWNGESNCIMLVGIPITFSIATIASFFSNLHSLILVLTAPKVWFILEIKNLIS